MKSIWRMRFVIALALSEPGFAQKLVDPNSVAPEYRAAAEARRAEQIKQRECAHKAEIAKVLPRDRIAHITKCLAEAEAAPPPAPASAREGNGYPSFVLPGHDEEIQVSSARDLSSSPPQPHRARACRSWLRSR